MKDEEIFFHWYPQQGCLEVEFQVLMMMIFYIVLNHIGLAKGFYHVKVVSILICFNDNCFNDNCFNWCLWFFTKLYILKCLEGVGSSTIDQVMGCTDELFNWLGIFFLYSHITICISVPFLSIFLDHWTSSLNCRFIDKVNFFCMLSHQVFFSKLYELVLRPKFFHVAEKKIRPGVCFIPGSATGITHVLLDGGLWVVVMCMNTMLEEIFICDVTTCIAM